MVPQQPSGSSPAGTEKAGQEELSRRLEASIHRMLELVSPAALSSALSAQSGFDSLSRLLDSFVQEHPEVVTLDRELPSDLRLLQARRELIEEAGGTYSTAEAAELLGISPEAVRKRIQRGKLLAYKTPGGIYQLPRVQFSETGVLDGLEEVLGAMHVEDSWMQIQLFLDDDVYGALQEGRREDAVRAVDSYLPGDQPGA